MTTTLCTLYNSYYLDKGLVLYDSLKACAHDFELYVLCMDEKCFDVLNDIGAESLIPIKLTDFESGDEKLLEAKSNRPFGQYCWTCSSSLILYILKKLNKAVCTYVDADMFFYRDPQILIDEMFNANKSILITPHRFTEYDKDKEQNGIFCVEFNTFCNNPDSLRVLEEWRNNCLESCAINDGVHYGDQKYLDKWPEVYSNLIYICSNPGAGIAPWNIGSYKMGETTQNTIFYKVSGKNVPMFFHHFESITYISRSAIRTGHSTPSWAAGTTRSGRTTDSSTTSRMPTGAVTSPPGVTGPGN